MPKNSNINNMRQVKTKHVKNDTKEPENEYLKQVVRKLCNNSSDSNSKKPIKTSVFFYFQIDDLNSDFETKSIQSVFTFLKKKKYIKNYSIETNHKEIFDDEGHGEMINYMKCDTELIPEKITNYAKELSILPKYFINYFPKTRELILNGKYILAKPNFLSENEKFIGYIINYSGESKSKTEIENFLKNKLGKSFHQILNDLGFGGELRKVFFPNVSNKAIFFRNNIFEEEIKSFGIDKKRLFGNLNKIKRYKKQ